MATTYGGGTLFEAGGSGGLVCSEWYEGLNMYVHGRLYFFCALMLSGVEVYAHIRALGPFIQPFRMA